jgi:hypothetical protein
MVTGRDGQLSARASDGAAKRLAAAMASAILRVTQILMMSSQEAQPSCAWLFLGTLADPISDSAALSGRFATRNENIQRAIACPISANFARETPMKRRLSRAHDKST